MPSHFPRVLFQILYLVNFKVCGNREIKYFRQFIDFSAIFLSVSIVSNARKGEGRSNNTRKQCKKCANIGIFAIFKLVYNANQYTASPRILYRRGNREFMLLFGKKWWTEFEAV